MYARKSSPKENSYLVSREIYDVLPYFLPPRQKPKRSHTPCVCIYIYISWHVSFSTARIIINTRMEIIQVKRAQCICVCVWEDNITVTKSLRGKRGRGGEEKNVIVITETNIIINKNTNTVDFNNRIRRVKCFGKIGTYSSARASGVKNRPTEKLNHCHH